MNRVDGGTKEFAFRRPLLADTDTSVHAAGVMDTRDRSATLLDHAASAQPRYLRGLVWFEEGSVRLNADSTIDRKPVPDVPLCVRGDPIINHTLNVYPHLFDIITPIKVDLLQSLLIDHPNQPYVESVCRALREGFWPWAEPAGDDFPDTHDEKLRFKLDESVLKFLRDQRDEELAAHRFSPAFGTELLPGMFSMPIHAVPKPNSAKLRLVTNHSAGPFALNSMISKAAIAGVVMDGVPAIGYALRRFRKEHGANMRLTMWKSDVSHAYRLIPMSPYWQIKQVVAIDGQRHVDCNNVFGGRGSERAWDAFFALVNWIAKYTRAIRDLMNYVDDDFAFDISGNNSFYAPYHKAMPARQVRLLELWDELGIPHEERKQLSGEVLTIIGFEIDPNAMTATLPGDAKELLISQIHSFCDLPRGGRRRSLKEFQSLTGYLNWAFNVFPLLKPGLSSTYAKLSGKTNPHAGIHLNKAIVEELSWIADRVQQARGVFFFGAEPWNIPDLAPAHPDHELVYTDASALGMGIWLPWHCQGFFCERPSDAPVGIIFYFEALAVCIGLHQAIAYRSQHGFPAANRIGVYSDNSNTVDIFNSLKALPDYSRILRSAVDLSLCTDAHVQFRVEHIAGKENTIADALSRCRFDLVRSLIPAVQINICQPPQSALGAVGK